MPQHALCASCGKRVVVIASTARSGPTCRDCRTRWCYHCRQPFKARHGSAFCSAACNKEFWAAFYQRQAS